MEFDPGLLGIRAWKGAFFLTVWLKWARDVRRPGGSRDADGAVPAKLCDDNRGGPAEGDYLQERKRRFFALSRAISPKKHPRILQPKLVGHSN
jgi:hypothetical protein